MTISSMDYRFKVMICEHNDDTIQLIGIIIRGSWKRHRISFSVHVKTPRKRPERLNSQAFVAKELADLLILDPYLSSSGMNKPICKIS